VGFDLDGYRIAGHSVPDINHARKSPPSKASSRMKCALSVD